MRSRFLSLAVFVFLLTAIAFGATGTAGAKDKPKRHSVYVFKLHLNPNQEVPPVRRLKADANGSLTLDVTRDSAGHITSGKVVFYVNYDFPHSVQITGLHVHQAPRGANGPIVVDSGIAPFTDADGQGNLTAAVTTASPATLQAIISNPKGFYVNLHTAVNPSGAMRDQLKGKGQTH